MSFTFSEGLRNRMAQGFGFARSLHNGYIDIRSGAKPLSADIAASSSGISLGIVSIGSATLSKETIATATLTVTGTAQVLGSVKIGTLPIVANPDRVDATATASTASGAVALAGAINTSGIARATVSGSVVTVYAPPGVGADWNGLALATTGLTCTGSNFASGVAGANGLYLAQPAAGVIAKPSGVVWSCAAIAAGTAGWFRFYSSDTADTGGAITTLTEPLFARMDGSVGVGSGDLQLSSLAFTTGPANTVTVDVASFTMPAQ